MQRRRGLVSQPIPSTTPHASISGPLKRARSQSVSSDDSSDSDERVADLQDAAHVSEEPTIPIEEKKNSDETGEKSHNGTDAVKPADSQRKQKKGKRDMSDETRWQKMKVVGSEQEVMVDLTRVQKYVDYDSSTVQAFQSEVQSAKGNFRQQALADYSDL
jgi:hypothetical protein